MSDRVASATASDAASEEEILSSSGKNSGSSGSNEQLTKDEVNSKLRLVREQYEKRISVLEDKLASLNKELSNERQGKEEAEIKLQMLRDQYEKDISTLDAAQPSKYIKDIFSKQYIDKQKQNDKTKDELILRLKQDDARRKEEFTKMRAKLIQAEKKNEEYAKKLAQLEEKQSNSSSYGQRVPSPPPIDYNSIFKELSIKSSTSPALGPSHPLDYSCTDIPPPPPVEVPLEDIMRPDEYYSQQHLDDNLSRHESNPILN